MKTDNKPNSSLAKLGLRVYHDFNLPRRIRFLLFIGVLFIINSIAIFLVLRVFQSQFQQSIFLNILIYLNILLALIFFAFVIWELLRFFRSPLHERGQIQRQLIAVFITMAIVPTIVIAVFAGLTLNFGLDGYFSDRVRNAVENSYETAQAYAAELEGLLRQDGQSVYNDIIITTRQSRNFSALNMHNVLSNAQIAASDVSSAFIIDGAKAIDVRGERSYYFNYYPPSDEEMERAFAGEIVIIADWPRNQVRYLRALDIGPNAYLYLSRPVRGDLLNLLDETERTALFYGNLDQTREELLILYAVIFLGVSLIIVFFAFVIGAYIAKRITRPIERLARAASRAGDGVLDVRVPEGKNRDEVNILSQKFNQMISDIQSNQEQIRQAAAQSEAEKMRFNSVLEGVSSGVIGLNAKRVITFINRAAIEILGAKADQNWIGVPIEEIAQEFLPIIMKSEQNHTDITQEQIQILRKGKTEVLFVRIAFEKLTTQRLISFDDVSALVQAQRMAAWGDVARRIAHEVKNPLTPIRLSAERIQRSYGHQNGVIDPKLQNMTEIIIRQTEDLKRIVDEFARFARMPKAEKTLGDWQKPLIEAIETENARNGDHVKIYAPKPLSATGLYDRTLMAQAFVNLIKNASESIDARLKREGGKPGEIRVETDIKEGYYIIEIMDNGLGLPADEARLFEPYITDKEGGTGLGLPIVKKIVEEHGGSLKLRNKEGEDLGAIAHMRLPIILDKQGHNEGDGYGQNPDY